MFEGILAYTKPVQKIRIAMPELLIYKVGLSEFNSI